MSLICLGKTNNSLLDIGKQMNLVTGREASESKRECRLSEEIDDEYERERMILD